MKYLGAERKTFKRRAAYSNMEMLPVLWLAVEDCQKPHRERQFLLAERNLLQKALTAAQSMEWYLVNSPSEPGLVLSSELPERNAALPALQFLRSEPAVGLLSFRILR